MPSSRWFASLLLLGALVACGEEVDTPTEAPRLGAQDPPTSAAPETPMNDLEEPVHTRLAPRLEDDGLTLEYVDCPRWSGTVPAVLECKAYVDGVVGEVEVELSKGPGGRVEFDAWLDHGVVATTRLVERLESEGYTDVDCGSTAAYAARLGTRIVCSVREGDDASHVVATVTDRVGHVQIEDY